MDEIVAGGRGSGKTLASFERAAELNPEGFTLAGFASCPWCGESVTIRATDTRDPLFVEDYYKEYGWTLGRGHASPEATNSFRSVPAVAWAFEPHGWLPKGRAPRVRCRGSDALIFAPEGRRALAAWASRSWYRLLRALRVRGPPWGPLAPPPPPGWRVISRKETIYIPTKKP